MVRSLTDTGGNVKITDVLDEVSNDDDFVAYREAAAKRRISRQRRPQREIPHFVRNDKGHAAKELGVDEHTMVKTIVMETETKQPLMVLMLGDRDISAKQLARILNCKSIVPCALDSAARHTGYQFGGTSPFGTRTIRLATTTAHVRRRVCDGAAGICDCCAA